MKTMTCNQLGGACDQEFQAETFEELAELSRAHGQDMAKKKDEPHLNAMDEMMKLMQTPGGLQHWMMERKKEFDAQPEL